MNENGFFTPYIVSYPAASEANQRRIPDTGASGGPRVQPHLLRAVLCELRFAVHRFVQHGGDFFFHCFVEQPGILATNYVDDFEGKLNVSTFVAEHPVGAGRQPVAGSPRERRK